jgi:hypothetical protein
MLSAVFRQHHDAPDFGNALADCEPAASGHRVDIVQRKDVMAILAVGFAAFTLSALSVLTACDDSSSGPSSEPTSSESLAGSSDSGAPQLSSSSAGENSAASPMLNLFSKMDIH